MVLTSKKNYSRKNKLSLDKVVTEKAAAVAEHLAYVGYDNDFGTHHTRVQLSCLYLLVKQLHVILQDK